MQKALGIPLVVVIIIARLFLAWSRHRYGLEQWRAGGLYSVREGAEYRVHFTPTYASWLNQMEIWFNIITQKAIRRGTFGSVKELVAKIEHFVHRYNADARPFSWTATPDSILEKIQRLCERISGTQH